MARLKQAWKPWGDHPVYVMISIIGAIVGIIVSIPTIRTTIQSFLSNPPDTSAATREETSGVVRDGITLTLRQRL
jgi:hypothetical protein